MQDDKLIVPITGSIRETLKAIDAGGLGIVCVVNEEEEVIGVVTDGDFRRAVLNGVELGNSVEKIVNRDFKFVNKTATDKTIINLFLSSTVERIPVLDDGKLVKMARRENYYLEGKQVLPEVNNDVPVVIMAGGKGTRLAPFTNIFPKPLLPMGDRSMVEIIMDEYIKYGFDNFTLTVNYKSELLKAYFKDLSHNYNIRFIKENQYLGTAGALRLIDLNNSDQIIVSNCDILIKENPNNLLKFHNDGNYDLTLVAAVVHHKVSYGVCTITNGGELSKMMEKPEYDYLVNTGVYIVNTNSLSLIPSNKLYHITDLIDDIKATGGNVGVYPVSERSWIDVGEWEGYDNAAKLWRE